MNEVAFVHSNLAPVAESSSLATMQPVAGVTCLNCGNLFTSNHANRKYCTEKCRKRSEYERLVGIADYSQRKCIICGEDFKPRLPNQKTCGYVCSYERLKARMRSLTALRTERNKNLIHPKQCHQCGEMFTPGTIQKQLIYCSKKCKLSARNVRRSNPISDRSCVICGTNFRTGVKRQLLCSKPCADKRMRYLFRMRMSPKAIQTRIANALRGRVAQALKSQWLVKTETTFKLCGCSKEFLFGHLEKQFTEGMNWENWSYNGWHIDHIIPCSSFDLSLIEDRQKCFHWSNLQPLWRKDNQQKGNRLDWSPAGL